VIVIADSGSTKCDWALIQADGEILSIFSTMGFNPFFHSKELISGELFKNRGHFPPTKTVEKVFFYGAGCSSPELNKVIEDGLKLFFTGSRIKVDHDLVGAAYATYSGEPGIACILGTGSNSCFFNGENIREEVPALAYILGDEGSGSYFGKRLLRALFYKNLPHELRKEFDKEFQLDKDQVFNNIYKNNKANVYLASFMKFVSDHQDHPFFHEMIKEGLNKFLEVHVKCYHEYDQVPVHFVGSVAHYCQRILEEACNECGVKLGTIEKKPIQGLIQYHLDYVLQEH
jgi:N-acetylglucosamine kinase-like BadF-type ATPase